jgi:hypothetical protein
MRALSLAAGILLFGCAGAGSATTQTTMGYEVGTGGAPTGAQSCFDDAECMLPARCLKAFANPRGVCRRPFDAAP